MAKPKKRNKAYRPRPVNRIPHILLGIEASPDRLKKLTAVARNALLKLHYEAAEEGDYLILTRNCSSVTSLPRTLRIRMPFAPSKRMDSP